MGGLIFRRRLAEAVLDGRKTQTRRRMNDNPNSPWFRERCGFQVGESYAVQPGRGKRAIGRVVIEQVRAEPLGAMTEADAQAEGFDSLAAFFLGWQEINGLRPDSDEIVWVLSFSRSPDA